ncbi:MAG: GspE/PulE family protein, partial [Thermoanaerobaculia bacterium]
GEEPAAPLPQAEEQSYCLDRERTEDEGGAVRLVDLILRQAIDDGSSDVHLDPAEQGLVLRFRIAGLLRDLRSFPLRMSAGVISRIKILAGLDIAERRQPQDGRIAIAYRGREIDLRVSSLPTVSGEKIVLRILDKSKAITGPGELGFLAETEEVFRQLISSPYGIFLITGPTGSGKTTTLYSALNEINGRDMNIVTLEDPVEYRLHGINQTQVNPRAGLTFASGLRASLRQDPDVIMVGEIRDLETAETAVHAALTGHLVFSTLHTNDASSTVVRLVDMGIEPFLISTSLVGVAAQRLVRRLCPHCREGCVADAKLRRQLGITAVPGEAQVFRGRGCLECDGTGFRGQIGIYELMPIEDSLRALITENAPAAALRRQARTLGMITLREDGVIKVLQGIT